MPGVDQLAQDGPAQRAGPTGYENRVHARTLSARPSGRGRKLDRSMEQAILIPNITEKVFARDLVDGQQVETVFVVREVSRRAKRNGDAFLKLQLGDVTGRVEAVCWDGVEAIAEVAAPGTAVLSRAPTRSTSASARRSRCAPSARPPRTSSTRRTCTGAPVPVARWRRTCAS